jgi:hypothetical protein
MAYNNPNNRRDFLKTAAKGGLALSLSGIAANALADVAIAKEPPIKPDHLVRSVPENMVWGYYGYDVPPVAHI